MTVPPLKFKTPFVILSAGLVVEADFEAYAWLISPKIFGPILEPANLVKGLSSKLLGINLSYTQALFIQVYIGAVVFSLAIYVISKLIKSRYIVGGLVTGLSLWFVAQGILAPVLGRPFMMNFGPYAQFSFVGHIGITLIIGFIFKRAFRQVVRHN